MARSGQERTHSRKRRGHGEGSVYQRADGYWVGQVEAGRDANGRRLRPRVVRRTKKAVLAELDALKRRASTGAVGQDETVAAFVDWWIDNVAAHRVAESSLTTYRARARSWIRPEAIGRVRLRKLRAPDVQTWLNGLAGKGIAPASRNSARVLLSSALKYAHGVGMVERNVVSFVAGAKAVHRTEDALTVEESEAVLVAAHGDRLEAYWVLALKYGMRPAELIGLRWVDVDLDGAKLKVAKSKSAAGVRDLPLLAGSLEALKAHRRRQVAEQLEAGPLWQDTGHVFTRADGRALSYSVVNKQWHELLSRTDVTDRRPYATRHSAATLLLEAGVPLEVVSAILGHSGLSITADVYAKVRADLKRKGLAAIDDR